MGLLEKLYLHKKNNLAYMDICVGVNNRNYFENVIVKKYENKEVYFTILDINNFKEINDSLGHKTGDEALKKLANILINLENVYEVCRYGGDEFILLHNKNIKLDEASNLFKSLTGYSFCYGTYHKLITESILFALEEADKILYKNKKKHWLLNDRRKNTDEPFVELSKLANILPNYRAGQLIYTSLCKEHDDLYYISNDEFLRRLRSFLENERNKE